MGSVLIFFCALCHPADVMSAATLPMAGVVVEVLRFMLRCNEIDRFVRADHTTWTPAMRVQPGYLRKMILYAREEALDREDELFQQEARQRSMCPMWVTVEWRSHAEWKAVDTRLLSRTEAAFADAFGGNPVPQEEPPGGSGFTLLLRVPAPHGSRPGIVVVRRVAPIACAEVTHFVAADNATYGTSLLSHQGFAGRLLLVSNTASGSPPALGAECHMWSYALWTDASALGRTARWAKQRKLDGDFEDEFRRRLGKQPPTSEQVLWADVQAIDEADPSCLERSSLVNDNGG